MIILVFIVSALVIFLTLNSIFNWFKKRAFGIAQFVLSLTLILMLMIAPILTNNGDPVKVIEKNKEGYQLVSLERVKAISGSNILLFGSFNTNIYYHYNIVVDGKIVSKNVKASTTEIIEGNYSIGQVITYDRVSYYADPIIPGWLYYVPKVKTVTQFYIEKEVLDELSIK